MRPGVVIAPDDLKKYVPLQLSNENFITTEYDKDKIESLGLLKMDLLGLRTLTVIGEQSSLFMKLLVINLILIKFLLMMKQRAAC